MNLETFKKKRIIYLIAALLASLFAGVGYSWSVLQAPIVSACGWSESSVALTYTLVVLSSTLTSVFFGPLIRKMGIRKSVIIGTILYGGGLFLTGFMSEVWMLYVCYSLMSGAGVGFINPPIMSYVVRIFPDKAGLAAGLGAAFYGAGSMVWAPIAANLTAATSIFTTFKILGIAFLIVILALSFLLVEPTEEIMIGLNPVKEGEEKKELKGVTRGQMLKTSSFYIAAVAFALGLMAGMMVLGQASPILQRQFGFEPLVAATIVSVISACNTAGRFVWGIVSDKLGLVKTIIIIFLVCAGSMACLGFISNTIVGIVCLGLAGACFGGFSATLTPYTSKLFGPKHLTENYAVMYIVFGIAAILGPMVASNFYGIFSSYQLAFLVAAAVAIIGVVLFFILQKKKPVY